MIRRCVFILICCWTGLAGGAGSCEDIVKGLETPRDEPWRHYYTELLHEVMEKTIPQFGPYSEHPYTGTMSSKRRVREAIKGDILNVIVVGIGSQSLDRHMIAIPYPIDKGLLGYRIAFIAVSKQADISKVDSIGQLRSFTIGQGEGWDDVRIYEHNGIPLQTAPGFELLIPMLMYGRFDLFFRGLNEVGPEFEAWRRQFPDLRIESHLLVTYHEATFFYVSRSEPHLAARIKAGLELMMQDGSFNRWFDKGFGEAIAGVQLDQRVVIALDNPLPLPGLPFDPQSPWWKLPFSDNAVGGK